MSIVVVGGDYGGAAALTPVIRTLIARDPQSVRVIAYGQAVGVWTSAGLVFETMHAPTDSEIEEVLASSNASAVVTGTSMNDLMLEQRFVRAARVRGLPSLAVLDAWVNYAERFPTADGGRCVPDRIAVMDGTARAEMIEAGFEPEGVVVTGQPAFDNLSEWADDAAADRARRLRQSWGAPGNALVVLFVSQPMSELYGAADAPSHFGYDEQTVLRLLISALEEISRSAARPVALVIRPHPREDASWLRGLTSAAIRLLVSAEGDARDAVLGSDLVTGMTSALLLEACYLGKVTVSLQPGLRRPDVLPTNRLGYSEPIYDAGDVPQVIRRALLDEAARGDRQRRLRDLKVDAGAAQRVIALIDDVCGVTQRS